MGEPNSIWQQNWQILYKSLSWCMENILQISERCLVTLFTYRFDCFIGVRISYLKNILCSIGGYLAQNWSYTFKLYLEQFLAA